MADNLLIETNPDGYNKGAGAIAWFPDGDLYPGTVAKCQMVMRDNYSVTNLWVLVRTNASPANIDLWLNKNGVDANNHVVIPSATAGQFEDITHTDTFVPGDLLTYRFDVGTNIFLNAVSVVLHSGIVPMTGWLDSTAGGNQNWFEINCGHGGAGNTVEANAQYPIRTATRVSNLFSYADGNTLGAASTITVRKNGVNGNNTITIPAATGGGFEDITHTDDFVPGDLLCTNTITGNAAGSVFFRTASLKLASQARRLAATYIVGFAFASAITRFVALSSGIYQEQNNEGYAQVKARCVGRLRNMFVRITANTINAASTIRTRKNAGNGNLVVTIPALTIGNFEDLTHQDDFIATDQLDLSVATGGGGGSLTIGIAGVEHTQITQAIQPNLMHKLIAAGAI